MRTALLTLLTAVLSCLACGPAHRGSDPTTPAVEPTPPSPDRPPPVESCGACHSNYGGTSCLRSCVGETCVRGLDGRVNCHVETYEISCAGCRLLTTNPHP